MNNILEVTGLTKLFNGFRAVDDLSFSVKKGEVHGFLGQNGAGKSTTIRMLLTLIEPDSGEIVIFGRKLKSHRSEVLKKIGAVIERPDLYKYLSALENIRIFAAVSGVKVSEKQLMEQLEAVGLASRAKSKVRTYSQGMRQRLGLACALVHSPELIILDEPTNGLDPQGIADMRSMITQLSKEQGKTMLVSSHLLNEMEMVADSMLIINNGRKVVEGKVKDLLHPEASVIELTTHMQDATLAFLNNTGWGTYLKMHSGDIFRFEFNKQRVAEFNKQLVESGIEVSSLALVNSLEQFFLSQTQA
ncbi:MAG: ABC transporter ATP-binding protein [Chitinophagaceae bacterium]|nr:ABC transporter ATP-binding protein [Chitinophagaceae bacterium]